MTHIRKYGSYTVGSHASASTLGEAIRLILMAENKRLPQNNYSFEDLKDLESKLVLITGRESEERHNVDQFLHVR